MKKCIILILLLVATIFSVYYLLGNNRNELSELGAPIKNIKLEYKVREDLETIDLIFTPFL